MIPLMTAQMTIKLASDPDLPLSPKAIVPGRRRLRLLAALVILAVASAAAWRLLGNTGPELLLTSDRSIGGQIYQGRVYSTQWRGNKYLIESQSLDGANRQVIGNFDASATSLSDLKFVGGYAYYVLSPQLRGGGGMGGVRGVAERRKNLGSFLLNEHRELKPGETRRVFEHDPPRIKPGELHQVSLKDGVDSKLNVDTLGLPIQQLWRKLTGETMLWIHMRDRRTAFVSTATTYWYEYPANSELVASPLDGGPARKVADGLSTSLEVSGDDEGIWWKVRRTYPDTRSDLQYYAVRTGRRGIVPNFHGDVPAARSLLAVYGGKLYTLSENDKGEISELLEYDPDRPGPRTVMQFPDKRGICASQLEIQNGKLCLTYSRSPLQASGRHSQNEIDPKAAEVYFGVLDPAHTNPIQQIAGPLTGGPVTLDGEYVYYRTSEHRRQLFDFLSAVNTQRAVHSLFRIRLRPRG